MSVGDVTSAPPAVARLTAVPPAVPAVKPRPPFRPISFFLGAAGTLALLVGRYYFERDWRRPFRRRRH